MPNLGDLSTIVFPSPLTFLQWAIAGSQIHFQRNIISNLLEPEYCGLSAMDIVDKQEYLLPRE